MPASEHVVPALVAATAAVAALAVWVSARRSKKLAKLLADVSGRPIAAPAAPARTPRDAALDRRELLDKIGDEAVALSEQMHKFHRKANAHLPKDKQKAMEPTSHDKAQTAVSYMRERCVELAISASDAELRKVMEIRLSVAQGGEGPEEAA